MQAETHPELSNAVVDAALVLVDVGPGVAGSTKGGDIAFWGLRNAAEPGEHYSARWGGPIVKIWLHMGNFQPRLHCTTSQFWHGT